MMVLMMAESTVAQKVDSKAGMMAGTMVAP